MGKQDNYNKSEEERNEEYKKALVYQTIPYPKEDNQRYDASYKPAIQLSLF